MHALQTHVCCCPMGKSSWMPALDHPNRSFARRHTCGDIRSLLAREHQWPCTFRCATLLSTVRESISRRSGDVGSKRDFRCGAISRFTFVTRKRVGISRYIHLVTPDGCGDEYC